MRFSAFPTFLDLISVHPAIGSSVTGMLLSASFSASHSLVHMDHTYVFSAGIGSLNNAYWTSLRLMHFRPGNLHKSGCTGSSLSDFFSPRSTASPTPTLIIQP
jgi:hypothetical protein